MAPKSRPNWMRRYRWSWRNRPCCCRRSWRRCRWRRRSIFFVAGSWDWNSDAFGRVYCNGRAKQCIGKVMRIDDIDYRIPSLLLYYVQDNPVIPQHTFLEHYIDKSIWKLCGTYFKSQLIWIQCGFQNVTWTHLRWSDRMNLLWQTGQTKFFSPVWVLVCLANSSDLANLFPHPLQWQGNGLSPENGL